LLVFTRDHTREKWSVFFLQGIDYVFAMFALCSICQDVKGVDNNLVYFIYFLISFCLRANLGELAIVL
jgi:hypothetical protein